MFGWLRELLEIRYDFKGRKTELSNESRRNERICESCETLRTQLEISNHEKRLLLEKILNKEKDVPPVLNEQSTVKVPRNIPWNLRRQMLESEDREKARLMRESAKPSKELDKNSNKESIEELEKELNIAESIRSQGSSGI